MSKQVANATSFVVLIILVLLPCIAGSLENNEIQCLNRRTVIRNLEGNNIFCFQRFSVTHLNYLFTDLHVIIDTDIPINHNNFELLSGREHEITLSKKTARNEGTTLTCKEKQHEWYDLFQNTIPEFIKPWLTTHQHEGEGEDQSRRCHLRFSPFNERLDIDYNYNYFLSYNFNLKYVDDLYLWVDISTSSLSYTVTFIPESNIWITICDVMIGVVVQIITRVIILERCRGVFKVINIILYSAIFTICCPLLPILLFHLIGGGLFKISMTSKIFSSFVTVIASFFFYKDQLTSLVYQFGATLFCICLLPAIYFARRSPFKPLTFKLFSLLISAFFFFNSVNSSFFGLLFSVISLIFMLAF